MTIDDLTADLMREIERRGASLSLSDYRELLAALIETLQERELAADADAENHAA